MPAPQARLTLPALLLSSAVLLLAPGLTSATEPEPDKLIDALNTIFGKHNVRASHAKGQCVAGTFKPSSDAAQLTRSASLTNEVTMLGRFSMGGGNPKISDGAKAAVRGFAFRLDEGGKASSDFAFINAPVQFAKTPAQFLGFLEARFPGADGKPDPAKIKAFSEANPETTTQGKWLASKPVPASYAGVNYWGVHAFTLTNAKGESRVAKLKLVPAAGEAGLSDDEVKAKPVDFLVAELRERLAKGPAAFDFVAILGEAGDPLDDATAVWPEESRKQVKLGTLAVTKIEDNAKCDTGIFDPTQLADGIAGPEEDPLFAIRSPAYAVSFSRRTQ
jgi:catalase